MNKQELTLYKVVDSVVDCCSTLLRYGVKSFTSEDVLGKSRKENVVIARCIIVSILLSNGFTTSTIAELLNRSTHAIRNLMLICQSYLKASKAFKLIYSECATTCADIFGM